MKKYVSARLTALAVGAGAMVAAGMASATAIVDYSAAITSATAEITSSVATGVPLFGTILAIGVGIKMVKRFAKG